MTDFLDEKRQEITERLKELKPLVDEYTSPRGRRSGAAGRRRLARRRNRRPQRRAAVGRDARAAPAKKRRGYSRQRRKQSQKSGTPGGPPRRTAQRQRHARRRGAVVRAGPAGHHDPGARREDGHQAELPLPRPPGLEQENKVQKKAAAGTPSPSLVALACPRSLVCYRTPRWPSSLPVTPIRRTST